MVVPTLLAMTIVLVASHLAAGWAPVRRALSDLRGREPQIDGLRGLCALLVAAHHAVFVYLFWGRLVRAEAAPPLADFVTGRIARLVPAYLFAMSFAMVVVGFAAKDFVLAQSLGDTAMQVAQGLTFSFFGTPRFNGSYLAFAAIGVSWSLYYEWLFYGSLPFPRAAGLRRTWAVALPAGLALNLGVMHVPWVDYFIYGAIACELSRRPEWSGLLAGRWCGLGSAALFVAVNLFAPADAVPSGLVPVMLGLSFLPIAAGGGWGGLLRLDALRAIGAVSYSVYLLNISVYILLAFWIDPAPHGALAVTATETVYLLGVLCVGLATYHLVERPFMRGRHPARPSGRRDSSPAAFGQPQATL